LNGEKEEEGKQRGGSTWNMSTWKLISARKRNERRTFLYGNKGIPM